MLWFISLIANRHSCWLESITSGFAGAKHELSSFLQHEIASEVRAVPSSKLRNHIIPYHYLAMFPVLSLIKLAFEREPTVASLLRKFFLCKTREDFLAWFAICAQSLRSNEFEMRHSCTLECGLPRTFHLVHFCRSAMPSGKDSSDDSAFEPDSGSEKEESDEDVAIVL